MKSEVSTNFLHVWEEQSVVPAAWVGDEAWRWKEAQPAPHPVPAGSTGEWSHHNRNYRMYSDNQWHMHVSIRALLYWICADKTVGTHRKNLRPKMLMVHPIPRWDGQIYSLISSADISNTDMGKLTGFMAERGREVKKKHSSFEMYSICSANKFFQTF